VDVSGEEVVETGEDEGHCALLTKKTDGV